MSTLYLAPLGVPDLMHDAMQMTVWRQEGLEFGWSSNSPIPANSLLLRSAIVLALRHNNSGWKGKVRDLVLMHLVKNDLISDPRADDFLALLQMLKPRPGGKKDLKQLMDLMIKKLKNNFGCQGSFDHVMLGLGSFFNHSCAPNTIVHWDTVLMEANFYNLTHVKHMTELCISYTAFPIDDPVRRASLLKFECACFSCFSKQPPSAVLALNEFCPEFSTCWWCGKETDQLCSECQKARFCSKECRLADQPIHRSVCDKFQKKPMLPKRHRLGTYSNVCVVDYEELPFIKYG